jgi:hypothetical protein
MLAFLDDGLQSFRLLGESRCFMLLDADGIVGKELLLRGFEIAFTAKLRETSGNLLCGHFAVLLIAPKRMAGLSKTFEQGVRRGVPVGANISLDRR